MREFTTQPLTRDRIAQAFPLVQAALPGVSMEDWRAFADAFVSAYPQSASGILTVVSEQGYIAGLCTYRIERDLVHGRALTADHFMALDLFERNAVARALADRIEALARERHCAAVHTNLVPAGGQLPGVKGRLIRLLQARDHRIESVRMCKVLNDDAKRPHPHGPAAATGTAAKPARAG
ncbi:MAG: hypothetical protein V3S88_02975 [Alphaproteobacteria bacterium]